MYVRGLASTTRRPASRPSSTSAFALCLENRPPPARAASSSTTRKPTLCRVSAYSGPGLPSPTTRAGPGATGQASSSESERPPPTTPAPSSVRCAASTCAVGRRRDDVHDEDLGVRAQGGALGQRDVRGVDLGAEGEALDRDLDLLGDVRDVRLDLDRVQLLVDQGAGRGVAGDDDLAPRRRPSRRG